MARFFEKISFKQFKEDIEDNTSLYESYNIPKRSTKNSAGYDFFSIYDFVLKPGEIKKIATGIKFSMNNDEMLMLVVRSSMGFKYNVRMCNQIGIFESDYYNNKSNEGHAWLKIQNEGSIDYVVKKGDAICQGIFTKFLTVDNEEEINKERKGGLGSTDKE
jgi:dUTPase